MKTTRGKERVTLTQLIKIVKARHLVGVTIFKLSLCCYGHRNVTANSTTVSIASTSVCDLLKTSIRRKIQLEEAEKLFITNTSSRCSE